MNLLCFERTPRNRVYGRDSCDRSKCITRSDISCLLRNAGVLPRSRDDLEALLTSVKSGPGHRQLVEPLLFLLFRVRLGTTCIQLVAAAVLH